MDTPNSNNSFLSNFSFDDNIFHNNEYENLKKNNQKSCIMEPLNFTLFEQFNEYFLVRELDINIKEYFIYTKKLAPKKIIYDIINMLISYSCKYESDFCIPINCITNFGIKFDKKETLKNKILKLRNMPINNYDNIKKTLKHYKLVEHIDYELIRTDIIRESRFSENTVPIDYYLTREAFLSLIHNQLNKNITNQIILHISKVNYYYNEYRNSIIRYRLSELKGSIININKEVDKLSRLTEEAIKSDSDFVEFKSLDLSKPINYEYDNNLYLMEDNNDFSLEDEIEETKEDLFLDTKKEEHINNTSKNINMRNTICGIKTDTNNKIDNKLYATVIETNKSFKGGRLDINTDHIFSIHKNFKNVIKNYAINEATKINESLIDIENHIDKLVNGIEYRDTSLFI